MSPLLKNLLFALGLALIVWVGYIIFIKEDETGALQSAEVSQVQRESQAFLIQLQQLKDINLEDSLFTDPRFQSLVDQRQEVQSEPVGRDNPFLPVGQ